MNWILNLIGILIFFVNRYFGRKKKTIAFSWKYWFSDNWQEMATTLLLNLAFMIIIVTHETEVSGSLQNLPAWVRILGLPGLSLGLGMGLSWLAYELFIKKIKEAKK